MMVERMLSPRSVGTPALIAIIILAPLFLRSPYQYELAILICINAILAISLNLLMGYAGQISLAHAGFFGLGAYSSTILTAAHGWNGAFALAATTLCISIAAFLIARPILRLSGHYLAMATLGLGMIIYIVIGTERKWTGGPDGMNVPRLDLFGFVISDPRAWYWISGALLILAFLAANNLIESPLGRALRSIRGSELAAQSVGINVHRLKTWVFVLSASVASFMGGIFAFYSGFITPSTADFMHSVVYATMVVLGGMASVVGSIVGAAIMTLLPQYLTAFASYELLVYGVILMAIVILMPKGLVPTLASLLRKAAQ